ncbi:hypothetical protein BDZ89DRAFT_1032630 [Hymenopellis radicata]|nr:hypothetical protein BDZ89DRAFT_1032630 [Hymenopellis radicata]
MDSVLQSLSGLSIYVAVQFLHEPQRSAVGPILLGVWEGVCLHYIATLDVSSGSSPLYLTYFLRFSLYLYLANDLLDFALIMLWAFLGILFSEALGRKHWYDTVHEKRKRTGSRRAVYTHAPSEDRAQSSERPRISRHHTVARPSVPPDLPPMRPPPPIRNYAPIPTAPSIIPRAIPNPLPGPPPLRLMTQRPSRPSESVNAPPLSIVPRRGPSPSPTVEVTELSHPESLSTPIDVPATRHPITAQPESDITKAPIVEVHSPTRTRDILPATPNIPPQSSAAAAAIAPLSPISINYSHAEDIRTPAPQYTVSVPPMPLPVIHDPPSPLPLSAIDSAPFFFPRAMELHEQGSPARPMLFRPPPSIAQVLEQDVSFASIDTTPQSPTVLLNPPSSLPTMRTLFRLRSDNNNTSSTHLSGYVSDSDDGHDLPPLPSSSQHPHATSENISAIPIPIPLPAHLARPSDDSAAGDEPSPTPTVVSAISNSPGLNSRAEQFRKDAWQEETRRKDLQKKHATAVRNGDQKNAFTLAMDIQESAELIKKLHERAERRYYHEPTKLNGVTSIDVHGLLVPEAVTQTEKAFKQVLVEGRDSLRVIVGKGLHSRDGKAKLKPAIEQASAK